MGVADYLVIGGVLATFLGVAAMGHRRIREQVATIRSLRREVDLLIEVLDERALTLQGRCDCGYLHNVRGARKRLVTMRATLAREEGAWE
jgi:hypothetical protein